MKKMSDKFEVKADNIKVNIIRAALGFILLFAGIVGYKKNDKKNKYVSLGAVLSVVFGGTLLVTELEEDFKPIDDEEEEE